MLSPMPTVPHVLAAEVQGIDSRLLVVLTDTASLWVIGRDMAQVIADIRTTLAAKPMPEGYFTALEGQDRKSVV